MFTCLDSKKQQVHTEDLVVFLKASPDGIPEGTEGTVNTILSEEEVSVVPMKGLPEVVKPSLLEVKESLIADVEELESCEELQEILRAVQAQVKAPSRKKGKATQATFTITDEL